MKYALLLTLTAAMLLAGDPFGKGEDHHHGPPTATPEPATWVMLGAGIAVVIAAKRRRK